MRDNNVKLIMIRLLILLNFIGAGCNEMATDNELKADIATKAKQDIDFTGVAYTVAGRVVTLSGKCPTDKAKDKVESTIKGIAGVKDVVNTITIAPVVITADEPLKQAADSILKDYPQAQADVSDSMIIVKGQVDKKKHEKLIAALNKLQSKKVADELVIQQK